MKIWITRQGAFSLQCGGMSRLNVWFYKPTYVMVYLEEKDRSLPWHDISESEVPLYRHHGWRALDHYEWCHSMPFSKLFGYASEENNEHLQLADFVWKKVNEHFQNRPFNDWYEMEKEGLVDQRDFLLEIDLNVKMMNI